MKKNISDVYTVLLKDKDDKIKFDNTFPPTNRKQFSLHLKEDKVLEIIELLGIKKNSTEINYNPDNTITIIFNIGIKKRNNIVFKMIFDSYTEKDGLKLLLIPLDPIKDSKISTYNITIGYIYINKLIEKVNNKEKEVYETEERTIYITNSIIDNKLDSNIYKYTPLVDDMDKLIELINKFGVIYHINKKDKTITTMIQKFKYSSMTHLAFYLQSNPDKRFQYDLISIKSYKNFGIAIRFDYENEKYKIILDQNTVENIRDRLDSYNKKGVKL